jgi:hypothetical protein
MSTITYLVVYLDSKTNIGPAYEIKSPKMKNQMLQSALCRGHAEQDIDMIAMVYCEGRLRFLHVQNEHHEFSYKI